MKKTYAIFIILLCTLAAYGQDKETRAVWLTTVKSLDWPKTKATSPATVNQQKRELTDMLDRLKAININTILLQTRVRGTVIYPSAIEPWDICLTGREGLTPGYDPLRFAIDECHKRGMKIQAWVVTLPLGKWKSIGCKQMRSKYPKAVKKLKDEGFLNPESDKTADILADICSEIVRNYNVDGIHLDYMRYPDGWRVKSNRQQGRDNITRIVRKIYRSIKAVKSEVMLSCSPIGKYSDLTRYSSRGWNARDAVCQDAQGWLKEGIMDQLYPMIYFKENNFYPFAADWAEQCPDGRQVVSGLGTWMLDRREGDWTLSEVIRQLNVSRQLGMGQCHFRAKFVLDNHQGVYDYLRFFNFPDCWKPQETAYNHLFVGFLPQSMATVQAPETSPQKPEQVNPAAVPLLKTDGKTLRLTPYPCANRYKTLIVKSLSGTTVSHLPVFSNSVTISSLPCGYYQAYILDGKNNCHRVGFMKIERK